MAAISLCMIVRNEERFLAGCLASVAGLVDELVLVDTGSDDGTLEIAHQFGARVVEHAWEDDFAAARNAGLDVARGSHALVLDADERLAASGHDALRCALSDTRLLLGLLPLHNADTLDAPENEVLSGVRRIGSPGWVPRFFRLHPALRFTRRVHETLTPSLNVLRGEGLGEAMPIEAPIVHFGEVPSLRASLGRDERNDRLMRRVLEDDPADGDMAGHLAAQLLKIGRAAEARAVGERTLEPFLRAIDVRPAGYLPMSTVRLGYALAFAQVDTGAPEAALRTARACAARFPIRHPNLAFVEAYALERLERFDEAIAAYAVCLELGGTESSQQILTGVTGDLALLRVAYVLRAQRRHQDAAEVARRVGGAWRVEAQGLLATLAPASGSVTPI